MSAQPFTHMLSWSHSRAQAFQRCTREYFWRYYGSWTGWQSDALPEARTAYRLKHLSSLDLVLGKAVHAVAAGAIREYRVGQGQPRAERMLDQVRVELNAAVRDSRDRAGWDRHPKHRTMLSEAYRDGGLSDLDVKRTRERMQAAVSNLLTSSAFREALVAPYVELKDVDQPRFTDLEGVQVWNVPDVLLRLGDGRWWLVDWKVGQPEASHRDQLTVYALYAVDRHNAAVESIVGRVEYLLDGTAAEHTFTAGDLEAARQRIGDSIRAMERYHASGVERDRDAFPLTENEHQCQRCPFMELCAPELAARTGGVF